MWSSAVKEAVDITLKSGEYTASSILKLTSMNTFHQDVIALHGICPSIKLVHFVKAAEHVKLS